MTGLAPSAIYWDSNVFLSYLEESPGRGDPIDALIEQATRQRTIRIVTSVVTVAEVAFLGSERKAGTLEREVEPILDRIWDDPVFNLIAVTLPISQVARRLIRASLFAGPRLKPMDAIHVATARDADAGVLYTYDTTLRKHSDRYGFPIVAPPTPPPSLIQR